MTGTSSSKGRLFRNFDSYKNQEWLRRRKLRIEQVRQQSSEIAKALRQKVENEEKLRNLELAKVEELKFKNWRAQKLDEMERKLRFALEEFGLGHRLIENEPDPKEILETRNELNKWKAQERGDIAAQEELKRKTFEKYKKMSAIERKRMTRKLEDLRSALVCSISTHKQFTKLGDDSEILEPAKDLESLERKTTIKKKRKTPIKNPNLTPVNVKEVTVKKKTLENPLTENSQIHQEKLNRQSPDVKSKFLQIKNKILIDLNDVQNTSAANSNNKSLESKTTLSVVNSNTEKTDKSVEFYDYNSRYQCKTFREYPNVVEKIETFNMPQDFEIYKETVMNQVNKRKKEEADIMCRERGNKALKKERINREYNNLVAKLSDLHKREKIINAMQRVPSEFIHMNDDRILEKTRKKQLVMNSKFESLYYEAVANKNDLNTEAELPSNIPWSTEDVDSNERVSTKVSFSPTNLKPNSPATSLDLPHENSTSRKVALPKPKKKRKKSKRKLVAHIDKTLKECRELRESVISRIQSKSPLTSQLGEPENQIVKDTPKFISPSRKEMKKKIKTFKNQISQTENFEEKNCFISGREEEKQMKENDSLLVSSATSYKSPPCKIRGRKVIEFLQLSGLLSEIEGHHNCLNLKRKIEEALLNLLDEFQSTRSEDECSFHRNLRNPTLKDYILKLLNMSRERVANLSVSADSTPTPDFEGVDLKNHFESVKSESGSSCSCQSQVESQKSNDQVKLENLSGESSQNWKSVLGETSKSDKDTKIPKPDIEKYSAGFIEDYSKITKKCEEPQIEEYGSEFVGDYKKITKKLEEPEIEYSSEFVDDYNRNTKKCEEPEIEECSSESTSDYNRITKKCEEPEIEECSSESTSDYNRITKKCEKRIEELSNLLKKVRKEKKELLTLPSESSSQNNFDFPPNSVNFLNRPLPKKDNLLEDESIYSLSVTNGSVAQSTIDTFPDVLEELLEKKILTSPFKWYKEALYSHKPASSDLTSIESITHNFRKQMSKIKPCTFDSEDLPTLCSSMEEVCNLED